MRISDWSSDVCSSDLWKPEQPPPETLMRSAMAGLPSCATMVRTRRAAEALTVTGAAPASAGAVWAPFWGLEIGRASCRERVSVRVDLVGRRIIKKKKRHMISLLTGEKSLNK